MANYMYMCACMCMYVHEFVFVIIIKQPKSGIFFRLVMSLTHILMTAFGCCSCCCWGCCCYCCGCCCCCCCDYCCCGCDCCHTQLMSIVNVSRHQFYAPLVSQLHIVLVSLSLSVAPFVSVFFSLSLSPSHSCCIQSFYVSVGNKKNQRNLHIFMLFNLTRICLLALADGVSVLRSSLSPPLSFHPPCHGSRPNGKWQSEQNEIVRCYCCSAIYNSIDFEKLNCFSRNTQKDAHKHDN